MQKTTPQLRSLLCALLLLPVAQASAQCFMAANVSNITCDDNGTDADTSDDTFTFDVMVFGDTVLLDGSWIADDPDATTGSYGEPVTFGPYAIADGPVSFIITDQDNPACQATVIVDPPAPCSFACTTDAGTMAPASLLACVGEDIVVPHNGDEVLDNDDILLYVLHNSPNDELGAVFGISTTTDFFVSPPVVNTTLYLSAVAGNADGAGLIDFSDPCLSVAPGTPVFISQPVFADSCQQTYTLDCQTPEVTLGCPVDGVDPMLYQWSAPGGTDSTLTVSEAGTYSLNVFDGNGCDAQQIFEVVEDLETLEVSISAIGALGCQDAVILLAEPSSSGSFTYTWSNSMSVTSELIVTQPGQYCVLITSPNNCTASACITVDEVASEPIGITFEDDLLIECPNLGDTLELTVTGGTPPYTYLWSNGQTGAQLFPAYAGAYSLTVTDVNGCFATASAELTDGLIADAGPDQTLTCDNPVVTLDGSNSTSGPNIEYQWVTPGGNLIGTGAVIEVSSLNFYTLQVLNTEEENCFASDGVFVDSELDSIRPFIALEVLDCSQAELEYFGLGLPDLIHTWTLPDGSTSTENPLLSDQAGWHYLTTEGFGCLLTDSLFVDIDPEGCATLNGTVFVDEGDCLYAGDEPGLADWIVEAQTGGETFYTTTNADGYYELGVFPGEVTVTAIPPGPLWVGCQPAYTVTLDAPGDAATVDIPMQQIEGCPFLSVDIGAPFLRRCFTNTYWVDYCNDGTAPAEDAFVTITLDPFMTYFDSQFPPSEIDGNQYTFPVGDLDVNECGSFWLKVSISCDAVLGQTHCVEAEIFPQSDCVPFDPNWSGASLALGSECEDDIVTLFIENRGFGNMNEPAHYIVIEDGVMLNHQPGNVQLNIGETFPIILSPNGSTYRLEVDQAPFHPGQSMPALSIEGCGTNEQGGFSTGFVTQFPFDDADPWLDVDCQQNIGAYDPNDKRAYPEGFGDERFIYANTDLEYYIRFQNTGTDTAFNVVIRDTLSEFLDITSVNPGASSHDYEWTLEKRNVLVFTFENIMLPDSNVNLEGSQGFVKFRIRQQPDLPVGTQIDNSAAIYFDFNEPIITNTVQHTIGEDFLLSDVETQGPLAGIQLQMAPNPADQTAYLRLDGWTGEEAAFLLHDATGRLLRREVFRGDTYTFHREALPGGVYFFRLESGGKLLGQGKLVLK